MRKYVFFVCVALFGLLDQSFARTSFSKEKPRPNPKIVIVGAGVSGIGAAVHLLEYGFENITILEAEPRIGGRIHTIPYGENVIDLGAQWCHGEQGNLVYELASKEDLLGPSIDALYNITFARSNAEELPTELSERLANITDLVKDKLSEELDNYNGSLGDYMRDTFQKILETPEYADIDKKVAMEFYENFEKQQSGDEASDTLDDVSSKNYNIFANIDGDYFMDWKDKGYKAFLELLMKSNETGEEFGVLKNHLKLSKKVDHTSWQRDDYQILVKCEDGEEILADHVIVTVSLGVLKNQSATMFDPPLPKEKQEAIKGLQFGSFNKIFLEFPNKWWDEDFGGINFLWRTEDLEELRKTEKSWLKSLYGFNTLPYQSKVLEGWIIGEDARNMENMPLKDIQKDAVWLLKKFLNSTIEISDPQNVTISKWFSNPNFRGCYSYHSVETEKANTGNQFLANTVKVCDLNNYQDLCEKPILLFAGEATDSDHYATVHGALETGFREAQKIRDFYAYGPPSISEKYELIRS